MNTRPIFPIWIHCLFGLALLLYTIQPWSIRFGPVPMQVVIVWIIFSYLLFFKFELIKMIPAAYGKFIMFMIIITVFSVGLKIILQRKIFAVISSPHWGCNLYNFFFINKRWSEKKVFYLSLSFCSNSKWIRCCYAVNGEIKINMGIYCLLFNSR